LIKEDKAWGSGNIRLTFTVSSNDFRKIAVRRSASARRISDPAWIYDAEWLPQSILFCIRDHRAIDVNPERFDVSVQGVNDNLDNGITGDDEVLAPAAATMSPAQANVSLGLKSGDLEALVRVERAPCVTSTPH
jgi:hypothetical protein